MARARRPLPAERELEILKTLWGIGPSSVGEVNQEINKYRHAGYTTTLKLMQIMHEKKLLVRDDSKWPHVYKPAVAEEKTQNQLVGDLLEKAFSGSAEKMVIRALSSKKVTPAELKKIKEMLDEIERAHS